jgi:hypothetical protein
MSCECVTGEKKKCDVCRKKRAVKYQQTYRQKKRIPKMKLKMITPDAYIHKNELYNVHTKAPLLMGDDLRKEIAKSVRLSNGRLKIVLGKELYAEMREFMRTETKKQQPEIMSRFFN